MNLRHIAAACLLLTSCLAAETKTQLQYLPGTPVRLTSELSVDVSQSLPGMSLSTKGVQVLEALLSLHSKNSDPVITRPPFDLTFTLKRLNISLRANEEEMEFDSSGQDSNVYLSQVAKIIDRPISLRIVEDFQLAEGRSELEKAVRELPVLQEIDSGAMLKELFLHLFALGGEELTEGKVIVRDHAGGEVPALPSQVEYTITAIDDYNIFADLKGNIEKKSFDLTGKVQIAEEGEEPVKVSLNGTMEGKVRWNRDNAMLYTLQVRYSYTAMFRLGEWEWMMNAQVDLHNRTAIQ